MQNSARLMETPQELPVSHLETLNWSASHAQERRKRLRTRARLLAACARILAAKGYVGLRVAEIATEAQMSPGAFYVYFIDREEAAREVLCGLIRRLYFFDPPTAPRAGVQSFVTMIRWHLEALQNDAPLVRALCEGVLFDEVLSNLHASAMGIWRARLGAALVGGAEVDTAIEAEPAPDVLDFIIEGMAQRAGAPLLTSAGLSRMATEVARAWLATQPNLMDGARGARTQGVPVLRAVETRPA
ncbi:TetR/AcrR family transcriptional regulator [Phenylobacterium koreense]|uniref:AcrR family transcriptional regulator n=1 Tax=Phenylobacterium koreense TaxID=266125 RepID=A0ABV2EMY9_9CAUL